MHHRLHPHRPRRATGFRAAGAALLSALTLSGCMAFEPGAEPRPEQKPTVRISVADSDVHLEIMGELYLRVLETHERDAELRVESAEAASSSGERLLAGEADFIVGCTGELLADVNPAGAAEISAELAEQEEEGGGHFWVYDELLASLPARVIVTDPSSATSCEDAGEELGLPQQVVPIFGAELFSREEADQITGLTRMVTTEDLAEIAAAAEKKGSSVTDAVEEWVTENSIRSGGALEEETEEDSYLYQP
ncbi:MAG TPA: hypothetical protein VFC72_04740 [Corynebacterium sp.]|nr:hypothetical protein [Corynebacterium sp.]